MSGTLTGAARLAFLITQASSGYTGGSDPNNLNSYYANGALSAGYSNIAVSNGGGAVHNALVAGSAPLAVLAAGFAAAEATMASAGYNSDSITAAGVAAAAAVAVGASPALVAAAALAAAAACQAAEVAAFAANQTAYQISAAGAAAGAAAGYAVTSGLSPGGGTGSGSDTSNETGVTPVSVTYPNALDLEIANDALTRLAEAPIGSFADNSRAARAVSRLYPRARGLTFSAMDWGFARSRVVLGGRVGGVYPWAYQYVMPANVATPRYVALGQAAADGSMLPPQPYEQGISADRSTRVIWCDVSPAILVYTQEVLNNSQWDAGFVACMTWQLAAELALPVTGNGSLAQEMSAAAQRALSTQSNPGQPMAVTQQQRGPSTTTQARY